MRGRNGKWFGIENGGTVRKGWVVVLFKLCARIGKCSREGNAFVIVDVIERCTYMSQHKCIGSENRSRNGRGSVNREEGMDSGELMANFFLFNIEEVGDVFNHLVVSQGHFIAGRTVRRGRGNDVRGVASTTCGR